MSIPNEEFMRVVVTGVKDGRSCVVEEIDCTARGEDLTTLMVAQLSLGDLPTRPAGHGKLVEIPVYAGEMVWYRVRFPPNQQRPVHHTDTIDCLTVIRGWIDLVLDDGTHRLNPGDSVMQMGVDHGWRVGPTGCVASIVIFGTPKRAD